MFTIIGMNLHSAVCSAVCSVRSVSSVFSMSCVCVFWVICVLCLFCQLSVPALPALSTVCVLTDVEVARSRALQLIVSQLVSDLDISIMALTIFTIFCTKLPIDNTPRLTKPDFAKKLWFINYAQKRVFFYIQNFFKKFVEFLASNGLRILKDHIEDYHWCKNEKNPQSRF